MIMVRDWVSGDAHPATFGNPAACSNGLFVTAAAAAAAAPSCAYWRAAAELYRAAAAAAVALDGWGPLLNEAYRFAGPGAGLRQQVV